MSFSIQRLPGTPGGTGGDSHFSVGTMEQHSKDMGISLQRGNGVNLFVICHLSLPISHLIIRNDDSMNVVDFKEREKVE